MDDDFKPIEFETPEGTVHANEYQVESTPQSITAVTGEDLQWLLSLDEFGPDFVATYVPGAPDPELQDYDRAFAAWLFDDESEYSEDNVITVLGGYLGNKCVADFDMQWVSVTDEYGTDFAVRGKSFDLMAFPFSSVVKRIENDETEFLYQLYHVIQQTLTSGNIDPLDASD
jgi:hypothetical protein